MSASKSTLTQKYRFRLGMPMSSRAKWQSPSDIKAAYRNASFIANERVVFNIKGNDYRLVVLVRYGQGLMFIRFVGSHNQYNKIDAATI